MSRSVQSVLNNAITTVWHSNHEFCHLHSSNLLFETLLFFLVSIKVCLSVSILEELLIVCMNIRKAIFASKKRKQELKALWDNHPNSQIFRHLAPEDDNNEDEGNDSDSGKII